MFDVVDIPDWPPEVDGWVSPPNAQRVSVLSRIFVPEELRGQGYGERAMEALVRWADANGVTLALSPASDWGASKARLGFVSNKGRNQDFSISETMIRRPGGVSGLGAVRLTAAERKKKAGLATVIECYVEAMHQAGAQIGEDYEDAVLDAVKCGRQTGIAKTDVIAEIERYIAAHTVARIEATGVDEDGYLVSAELDADTTLEPLYKEPGHAGRVRRRKKIIGSVEMTGTGDHAWQISLLVPEYIGFGEDEEDTIEATGVTPVAAYERAVYLEQRYDEMKRWAEVEALTRGINLEYAPQADIDALVTEWLDEHGPANMRGLAAEACDTDCDSAGIVTDPDGARCTTCPFFRGVLRGTPTCGNPHFIRWDGQGATPPKAAGSDTIPHDPSAYCCNWYPNRARKRELLGVLKGVDGLGLPGGRADEAHRDPDDFDDVALAKGIVVEMEHTADSKVARQIAMDHLTERADYYEVLERTGLVDGLEGLEGADMRGIDGPPRSDFNRKPFRYKEGTLPHSCSMCGKVYSTEAEWEALDYVGQNDIPGDEVDPAYTIEMRNCACGTTLAVEGNWGTTVDGLGDLGAARGQVRHLVAHVAPTTAGWGGPDTYAVRWEPGDGTRETILDTEALARLQALVDADPGQYVEVYEVYAPDPGAARLVRGRGRMIYDYTQPNSRGEWAEEDDVDGEVYDDKVRIGNIWVVPHYRGLRESDGALDDFTFYFYPYGPFDPVPSDTSDVPFEFEYNVNSGAEDMVSPNAVGGRDSFIAAMQWSREYKDHHDSNGPAPLTQRQLDVLAEAYPDRWLSIVASPPSERRTVELKRAWNSLKREDEPAMDGLGAAPDELARAERSLRMRGTATYGDVSVKIVPHASGNGFAVETTVAGDRRYPIEDPMSLPDAQAYALEQLQRPRSAAVHAESGAVTATTAPTVAPFVTVSELADHYKARGLDRQQAWGQYVKDAILQPRVRTEAVDAKDFFRAFDNAIPRRIPGLDGAPEALGAAPGGVKSVLELGLPNGYAFRAKFQRKARDGGADTFLLVAANAKTIKHVNSERHRETRIVEFKPALGGEGDALDSFLSASGFYREGDEQNHYADWQLGGAFVAWGAAYLRNEKLFTAEDVEYAREAFPDRWVSVLASREEKREFELQRARKAVATYRGEHEPSDFDGALSAAPGDVEGRKRRCPRGERTKPKTFPYDPGATGYDDPPRDRVCWRMEAEYPLSSIKELTDNPNRAREYILDESEHPFFAEEGNAEDYLSHPEQAPLQLIEHADGTVTISDGWHRAHAAVAAGRVTLPAEVGREVGREESLGTLGAQPGDIEGFIRELTEATIAHLTHAFERMQVSDGRGGALEARSSEPIEVYAEGGTIYARNRDTQRADFAYAFYARQLTRGATGLRPWTPPGTKDDPSAIDPSVLDAESRLGLEVWKIGRSLNNEIDVPPGNARVVDLTDEQVEAVRVRLPARKKILESVRAALNWPKLDDYDPPSPSQWPAGELGGIERLPAVSDSYAQAFAKILDESLVGDPQTFVIDTAESGQGSSRYEYQRAGTQNADWYVEAGAQGLDQRKIREELQRVADGGVFNLKRKEGRFLADLLERSRSEGLPLSVHGADFPLAVPTEDEWTVAVEAAREAPEPEASDLFGLPRRR